jgi:hypothetical protein
MQEQGILPAKTEINAGWGFRYTQVTSSRRRSRHVSAGMSAISHSTNRMLVADVDQGSDTARATARPSAILPKRGRPKLDVVESVDIIHSAKAGEAVHKDTS